MKAPVVLLSIVAAIVLPAWLLWPAGDVTTPALREGAPIVPSHLPDDAGSGRRLFLDPIGSATAQTFDDAPVLAGIAGRLPHDAVAMVRNADGTTHIVAIGQAHEGWRLEALAPDAALFVRGARRLRVPLPAHDPAEEASEEQPQ